MDKNSSRSFGTAIKLFQEGRFDDAIDECRKILAIDPGHLDALQMTGLSLAQLGRKEMAVDFLESAHRLAPKMPALCNNLGELYRQLGRLADAEKMLRCATDLQPRFAEGAMNLGNAIKDQGRYSEAIEWFQRAVEWRPNYANAHLNLANTLWKEGRVKRAVPHYHEYLRLQPPRCDVLLSLGGAYADLGEHDDALKYYHLAANVDPENSDVDAAFGHVWLSQGDVKNARYHYGRIAARKPDCLLKKLRVESLCEIIPPSDTYIDEYRTRLDQLLDNLRSQPFRLDLDQLHSSGAEPPMTLAYQGRDDRALKEKYATLFSGKIDPIAHSRHRGKPHVGVVVTNGHEGVYAECLGRLVCRMEQSDELDVTVVCSRAGANIIPHLLGDSRVRYFALSESVTESAVRLAEAKFDLLHYWEVGTDSMNYFLPFFRPASIQSACWGWPVTTGQPHIHYFVSSRWIEPDNATDHYSERIVPLETLPTWYKRPPVPQILRSRSAFGLPEQGRVYLCTQNLRKYHPDFDPVLANLLERDVEGRVYLIEDSQPAVSRLLHARFARRFPELASRLILVPRQQRNDYLNLVAIADVVLDTPHYGGGANSLYDAFSCGTPIVTRPGLFHRSRYGQAVCRKLELPEMIADSADDFVSRAIRIASDPEYRRILSQKIQERCHILFEDDSAVKQHEQFFLNAISDVRRE